MPSSARGSDRPPRFQRPRFTPRFTRKRLAGAAALLVGLAVPAGVFGDAYTSFYGLDAYTTYRDPYTGASAQTVRPFWDFLGVFQRPVAASPALTAGYGARGAYAASYAPAVRTASYGSYYGGPTYHSGYSYRPVSSYYGGEIVTESAASYGGSFYDSAYAGGALPYGSSTSYSTYGSSCEPVTYSRACEPAPACSPCSDPCSGGCPGGNCTSYSVPGDNDVIESDPVYADPPLDRVPTRRPTTRDRNERTPLDPLEPPEFGSPTIADPPDRRRPRDDREDSVREAPGDSLFDEDFNGDDFSDIPGADDRPRGGAYEVPAADSEFGGVDDPMTGAGFGEEPGTGVRPAEGVVPYRRRPSGIAEPPGDRARPVPPTDASFPELDAPATGTFEDSAPGSGVQPGDYGTNPGGINTNPRPSEGFGDDPDLLGQPVDSSFPEPPDAEPAFGDDLFPGDAGGAFGDDPDVNRRSFRLSPNPVDLTGPPANDADDELIPAELSAPADADSTADEAGESGEALEDAGGPGSPAPLWDGEPADESLEEMSTPSDSASDAASAPPRLITAELLRAERQRIRVPGRTGRTRIARFRHRPTDSIAPTATPDVQIAAQ